MGTNDSSSADKLIVHESVAEEFTKILSGLINDRPANATASKPNTYRGLFSQNSADRVNALVKDAVDKGAKIVAGKQSSEKNVVQPVIVANTTPEMRIYSEEIFGPAFSLNTFKTNQEAIDMANASEYGLYEHLSFIECYFLHADFGFSAASVYGVRDWRLR